MLLVWLRVPAICTVSSRKNAHAAGADGRDPGCRTCVFRGRADFETGTHMFEATSRVGGGLGLCAAHCLVACTAGRGAVLTVFTVVGACALRRLSQVDDSSARRLRKSFTTSSSCGATRQYPSAQLVPAEKSFRLKIRGPLPAKAAGASPANIGGQFLRRPVWEGLFQKIQERRNARAEQPPRWVERP